jgi:hypothetical protein
MPEHRARKHHQDRVAETLREEIGAMIEGELSGPRIASCFTSCPAAWFAFATSDSSPTADGVLRSNVVACCSARQHASIRPSQPACAVQPVPPSCWSSNGSRVLNFTSSQT